jgi:hypothetical protein
MDYKGTDYEGMNCIQLAQGGVHWRVLENTETNWFHKRWGIYLSAERLSDSQAGL